jgi:Metallo-peptidase family M12
VKLGRSIGAVLLAAAGIIAAAAPASAAPDAGAAPARGQDAVVTSVQKNANGTITETTYAPAPGVMPDELATRLRARGIPNVTVTYASEVSTLAAACSYGTARTWPSSATCFARWSYNNYARPQIYFIDHSGAEWPVGRSVTKWNETSGIDSVYRTASSGCPGGGIHCVHVYSGNYGDGWTGQTTRTLNDAQTYYESAVVQLNTYYSGTEAQRWNTSCHELGHVLGLGHNTSTTSCVYAYRTSQKYPNSDDFTLLERYY